MERLLEKFNAISYASFIPDYSPHVGLQAPARLSEKAEDEQESAGILETENTERSRMQRPRLRQGRSPGSSHDKLTWSQQQQRRPGPGSGVGPGGLAEAEMSALISPRPASPLAPPCHGGSGPRQARRPPTAASVWGHQ